MSRTPRISSDSRGSASTMCNIMTGDTYQCQKLLITSVHREIR